MLMRVEVVIGKLWCAFSSLSAQHSTEVPELQDVVGPKSMAPPLTAQTAGPNWLKFFVEAPQEDTFRGIEGIFEFRLRS